MKKYRAIIVVGGPGKGKSTFIKNVLLRNYKGPRLIYDINNEYPEGLMMPMEKFIPIAKSVSNHLILFEEATIFFSNKGDVSEIRYLLVSRRHRNNIIVFTFHSLQQIPLNILILCDVMFLFHTGDNYALVQKKFGNSGNIFDAFLTLKGMEDKFAKLAVPLNR